MASTTAAHIIGAKYPEQAKLILKLSEKWEKRTKQLDPIWPKEGTFDPNLCEIMETRIKDYKANDKSKKREEKRKLECEIMNLFKSEGQSYRKKVRSGLMELKNKSKKSNNVAGLYPTLVGKVKINGDFKYDPDDDENNDSGEDNTMKSPPPPKSRSRFSGASDGQQPNGDGIQSPEHQPIPRLCSTEMRPTNRPGILDCYAERSTTIKGKQGSESYWVGLEHNCSKRYPSEASFTPCPLEEEPYVQRTQIEVEETHGPNPDPRRVSQRGREFDLRYRPNIKPPDRYTDPGQYPILIKGTKGHYIPWQTLDLAGLLSRLPDVHEGAGKWIRRFEEETVGKLLAIGDIKAVLAQVLGATTMENLLRHSGNGWMIDTMSDGTEFNAYRSMLWKMMRDEFPSKIDPKALKGEPLGETENPAAYISKQLKRWKQETEAEAENTPLLATLFRNSVIEALPPQVQSKLEDVVGLTSMPHREFRDHVVHAIDRHRKDERKRDEQDKNMQRKISQLQLNELQTKTKTQATVMDSPMPKPMTPSAPPSTQPFARPPVVNVYQQPPYGRRPNMQGRGPFRPWGRGMPRQQKQSGPPGACWNCGRTGHRAIECRNPAPSAPPVTYGGQSTQRRGPVNPWAGPNYGY